MPNVRDQSIRSMRRGVDRHDDTNAETIIGSRVKPQTNGCWLFDGKPNRYGQTSVNGVHVTVHRFVYEVLVGPIPDGHHLHHTCQTPGCCNPAHLMPLTPGEHQRLHAEQKRGAA